MRTSRPITHRLLVITAAGVLSFGCGSSDDEGDAGSGGTAGTGGTAGSGGDGGSGGIAGSGGHGGSAGEGGTAGHGGSGGEGAAGGSGGTGGSDFMFSEDFESGIDPWFADNGVWEVGKQPDPATSGPDGCFSGSGCAATVLDGMYPGAGGGTGCSGSALTSRLVSAIIVLPAVAGNEELHLRFWNWFGYRSAFFCADHGQVQIAVRNENGTFGEWISVGTFVSNQSGWTQKNVDLTLYAGETVRIAFLHTAGVGDGAGWYIDDIELVTF